MQRIDLQTAVREIVQSSAAGDSDSSVARGQQPFFFIVGAGLSHPSIPLASAITEHCKAKAISDGCDGGADTSDPIDRYVHWLAQAYPSPMDRHRYFHGLIRDAPISHATLRLVHLLESHRLGDIVVTPNFDDLIARGLSLFGEPFIVCDHPAAATRIRADLQDAIQIIHVHGTHWNYDIRNLRHETTVAARDEGPRGMRGLMRHLLALRSPLILGYAGWEGDVIMTALREHCGLPAWRYNLYWFCYNEADVRALPAWLTAHNNVRIVAPTASSNTHSGDTLTMHSPGSRFAADVLDTEAATLSAVQVIEALIRKLDMPAPRITTEPLGVFREQLKRLIPQPADGESDEFGFADIITQLDQAIVRVRESAENAKSTDGAEAVIAIVRERLRRSQTTAVLDGVSRLYQLQAFDKLDPSLRGAVAFELVRAFSQGKPVAEQCMNWVRQSEALAEASPEDPVLRLALARVLFNAMHAVAGDSGTVNKLLLKLQQLSERYKDDMGLVEAYARALVNRIGYSEESTRVADDLLVRLAGIAKARPAEGWAQHYLAKGMFNASLRDEDGSARFWELLGQLSELAQRYKDIGGVQITYAKALNNALARSDSAPSRRVQLLEQLRYVAQMHPDDAEVRESMAKGLANAINHAGSDDEVIDRALAELEVLAADNPDDTNVREMLATGMFNAFNNSEGRSSRATEMLGRLQTLYEQEPTDGYIRGMLASALFNESCSEMSMDDRGEGACSRLEELVAEWPDDEAVRHAFAKAVANLAANDQLDSAYITGLLRRLGDVSKRFPEDTTIAEAVATALSNRLSKVAECGRADELLEDARELAQRNPRNEAVQVQVACGLVNQIAHAEKNWDRSDKLLKMLEERVRAHPSEAMQEALSRAHGARLRSAVAVREFSKAAAAAESLIPLRSVVSVDVETMVKEDLDEAIELVGTEDTQLGGQLRLARAEIFAAA